MIAWKVELIWESMYFSGHSNSVLLSKSYMLTMICVVGGASEVNAVDMDTVVCSYTEPN